MSLKQPKVSTRTIKARETEERILSLIIGENEAGISPKRIYSITKINGEVKYNTIKGVLKRLETQEKIKKHPYVKGNYIAINSNHDIFEYNIHNLMLTTQINSEKEIEDCIEELELGTMTLQFNIFNNTKNVIMRLSTPFPFNVASISLVSHIFNQFLINKGFNSVADKDILIKTIEFNKDVYNSRLEGISNITLDGLITQFKMYQKTKNSVRIEYKNKVTFGFDVLSKLLLNGIHQSEVYNIQKEFKEDIELLNKKVASICQNQMILSQNQENIAKKLM